MSTILNLSTSFQEHDENQAPTPADLPAFIPFACQHLQAPFTVVFKIETQEEYVRKVEDKHKKSKKTTTNVQPIPNELDESGAANAVASPADFPRDENEIVMKATMNPDDQVVEVILERLANTPRMLIKIVGLCLPFCQQLTTITIKHCKINGYILYEIAKCLPKSRITDLYLDDSPIPLSERCYCMLFDRPNNLRCLSLARCRISDADCALLVSCLVYPLPASKALMTLDLTGNFITDVGARSIGECLRSNRALKYLNLAGNHITDIGAAEILKSLAEFPLTYDEIRTKKHRYLDFLKMRQKAFQRFYEEAAADFTKTTKRKITINKRASANSLIRLPKPDLTLSSRNIVADRAELMTQEFVGNHYDPYSLDQTVTRDRYTYCIGNMSLCYLNLAYNDLGYWSLKKLVRVVQYQRTASKAMGTGLLGVQTVGNNMPMSIEHYILQDFLENAQMLVTATKHSPRQDKKSIRKSYKY